MNDNCVNAIGEHSSYGDIISHSHKSTSNGVIRTETLTLDLESLTVFRLSSPCKEDGSSICGAWYLAYTIDQNSLFCDSENNVIFDVIPQNDHKCKTPIYVTVHKTNGKTEVV